MRVLALLVELCQILQLLGSGSVMTSPACLEGAHQEEREDVEVEFGLERGQLVIAVAKLVENSTKSSLFELEVGQDENVLNDARLLGLELQAENEPESVGRVVGHVLQDVGVEAIRVRSQYERSRGSPYA